MQKDYYKILAISENTEQAQIKQHAQSVLEKAKQEYEAIQTDIKKAYSVIANLSSRQVYDHELKTGLSTPKNYYQILRIAPNTEQHLIKDLAQNTVNMVKQEYEKRIAEIREAYSVLGQVAKRTTYDNSRLQEEKRRQTLKRQKVVQHSPVSESRFSLKLLIAWILLIGLIYFGYTKYQEDVSPPEENQPFAEVAKDSQIATTFSEPSKDIYSSDSVEEEIQIEESPSVLLSTVTEDIPTSSSTIIDSQAWKEEAEALLAAERQPASLSFHLWEEGIEGYETIMSIAHSSEEPVIVYFHADWCPWCQKLGRDYFSHYQLENFLHNIPKVKIIPDNSKPEKQLFQQYGGTGYPSVFIYVPAFKSPPIAKQPFKNKGGDWSPEEYMLKLKKYIIWAYTHHASTYASRSQYEQARYYYRKALLYDPDNADIYYSIGLTYHKDGYDNQDMKRLWLAKISYLEALKYDPNHQNSQRSLKTLKNL